MVDREFYDTMQVCVNGHMVTDSYDSYPTSRSEFCASCGARTITKCEICGAKIRGHHYIPGVVLVGTNLLPASHCRQCGGAFPWTKGTQLGPDKKDDASEGLAVIRLLCSRFHLVASQLKHRRDSRLPLIMEDEYDVQYLLLALLTIHFADVRPEEWTPSSIGSPARMDFLLKKENIVVEAKMTRKGLNDKKLGEELIIDIARYKSHPDCKALFCLIYDPERFVKNPAGLETDLSRSHDGLEVEVIVTPGDRRESQTRQHS